MDLNFTSWGILCVQRLLMREIVLIISQIPSVGIELLQEWPGLQKLVCFMKSIRAVFAGLRSLTKGRFSHSAFSYFLS